ncbi:MAG: aldehyde dehydrogenase family protein [Streptomycetaceae bacterium]|nr:MAG: aldehyde dehydrogenase family protein [Streptomycetaceae bacterium]
MSNRIDVKKTYKLFINGAFPRTESGRTYEVKSAKGVFIANPCLASRKDLKEAVVAARAAQPGWNKASAYNKGQILYRIAEMLEGRRAQFVDEIILTTGVTKLKADKEVTDCVDRLVWYAGWSDKLSSLSGALNPVAGPYYNFTVPESMGVIAAIAPETPSLLGLIDAIAPIIVGGNTVIVLASTKAPLSAMSFAEVIATSDVPAGVINILTGKKDEIAPWMASHMDIDGFDISGLPPKSHGAIRIAGAENLKRIFSFKSADPGRILAFLENKTVWHPIGL